MTAAAAPKRERTIFVVRGRGERAGRFFCAVRAAAGRLQLFCNHLSSCITPPSPAVGLSDLVTTAIRRRSVL